MSYYVTIALVDLKSMYSTTIHGVIWILPCTGISSGGIYDSVLPLLPCFAQQLSRMESWAGFRGLQHQVQPANRTERLLRDDSTPCQPITNLKTSTSPKEPSATKLEGHSTNQSPKRSQPTSTNHMNNTEHDGLPGQQQKKLEGRHQSWYLIGIRKDLYLFGVVPPCCTQSSSMGNFFILPS